MSLAAAAAAQDFRVDSEIFVDEEQQPFAETLTIFSGGRVYDFLLGDAEEITIFEPARGQFTLLDPSRKLRCTLASQELLDYVQELNKAALASKSPLFADAANPTFETKSEQVEGGGMQRTRVTLKSKLITYEAIGKEPEQVATAEAFQQFADWYARLNALRGGGLPPAPRLALNKELAERKMLPDEIVRTTSQPGLRDKTLTVRSQHLFNWTLSVADRDRIEKAGDYLARFQAVSFKEFRTLPDKPAAEKTTRR
jgi:hypothetical protein